ncbi:MAG: ABC transporter permease [Lachnospiraceae bacterium]
MLSYTAKRLVQTIFVLVGISLITFVLLQVVPGNPVALMLEKRADPETIAKVRHELGLDLPYYVQYLNFIKGAVHLDFGTSYFTKEVVTDALMRCFKVTVKLACMSFVFAAIIGIPCGIFAAVKRGKGIDTVVMVLAIIGVSAPAFWVAIILQIIFGLKSNMLPILDLIAWRLISCRVSLLALVMQEIWHESLVPMLEVLGQDYIRTAKAKGVKRWAVILKHALKNAMIPIVTLVGTDFGYMLTGSMLIEKVFSIPGIGKLAVDAMSNRDLPLLEGTVMYIAFVFVVVNLLVDVSYAFLDPRIRYGKGA